MFISDSIGFRVPNRLDPLEKPTGRREAAESIRKLFSNELSWSTIQNSIEHHLIAKVVKRIEFQLGAADIRLQLGKCLKVARSVLLAWKVGDGKRSTLSLRHCLNRSLSVLMRSIPEVPQIGRNSLKMLRDLLEEGAYDRDLAPDIFALLPLLDLHAGGFKRFLKRFLDEPLLQENVVPMLTDELMRQFSTSEDFSQLPEAGDIKKAVALNLIDLTRTDRENNNLLQLAITRKHAAAVEELLRLNTCQNLNRQLSDELKDAVNGHIPLIRQEALRTLQLNQNSTPSDDDCGAAVCRALADTPLTLVGKQKEKVIALIEKGAFVEFKKEDSSLTERIKLAQIQMCVECCSLTFEAMVRFLKRIPDDRLFEGFTATFTAAELTCWSPVSRNCLRTLALAQLEEAKKSGKLTEEQKLTILSRCLSSRMSEQVSGLIRHEDFLSSGKIRKLLEDDLFKSYFDDASTCDSTTAILAEAGVRIKLGWPILLFVNASNSLPMDKVKRALKDGVVDLFEVQQTDNLVSLAIRREQPDLAALFFEFGVPADQSINGGSTAIELAESKGYLQLLEYFRADPSERIKGD